MRHLYRYPLAASALLILLAPLGADDTADRERRAKAALALAVPAKPTVAAAPAPRVAVTRDYSAGVRAAVADEKPLVVFVGCPGSDVPGAIVAKADALGDVKAPAVVVGFPVGDRLFIHATLDCPVPEGRLAASVKAASRKINDPAPKEMPAPKPLNWDVRADVPAKLPACGCGDVCPCQAAKAKQADVPIKADPVGACVRVSWDRFGASGVCVASEGGKSLVVSCNHVFTEKRTPQGEFARADYPLACSVRTLDGKRTLRAIAVDGDKDADLAFLVVDGELPAAEMAPANAPVGAKVWHRGIGSGGGEGKVLPVQPHPQPKQMFASDCSSDSGDSGAGLFDADGRLVAINCGRHGMGAGAPQRGTPITPVRNLLRGVARTAFPGMSAKLAGTQAIPAAASVEKPVVVKTAGGKVLMWQGQPLADQDPNGYFAEIKKAWPGGATVETAGAIDYYPDQAAWQSHVYALRPTGPVTITTPGGGTATVTVEGPGASGARGQRAAPTQPACPNGRCPLQR